MSSKNAPSLRRSWLYVPGDSERKLTKALSLDVDVVIADLEDAVIPERKEYARSVVRNVLQENRGFRDGLTYVRINPTAGTEWRIDVQDTADAEPDGYVLPKVESPSDVLRVVEHLQQVGQYSMRRMPELSAIVTETARGVVEAPAAIKASELVTDVHWGAEDLSGDLGTRTTRTENGAYLSLFEGVRSRIILEAKALGRRVVDAPYLVLDDSEGLRREALEAARMGFDGKQAIHPAQITSINDAFTPTPEEVERARALIEESQATSNGAFTFRGEMVDPPHVAVARKVIALHDAVRKKQLAED